MKILKNNQGSALIFITVMVVLLLVMVGLGLDSGWLTFARSQGQRAVDAAALAGASAIPTLDQTQVDNRVAAYQVMNDYVGSPGNALGPNNATLVSYNAATGIITPVNNINLANGVRVALEETNPHPGASNPSPNNPVRSPLFLAPLLNWFGAGVQGTTNLNVSAVAVLKKKPNLPMALLQCPPSPPPTCIENPPGSGTYDCTLQATQQNDPTDNTAFTSFTLGSANAKTFKDLVNDSSCNKIPAFDLGDCINVSNGQVNTVVQEIIDVYTKNPNRCFFIPVIDTTKAIQCPIVSAWANICFYDTQYNDGVSVYKAGSKPGTSYPSGPAIMETKITCGANIYGGERCSIPVLVRGRLATGQWVDPG